MGILDRFKKKKSVIEDNQNDLVEVEEINTNEKEVEEMAKLPQPSIDDEEFEDFEGDEEGLEAEEPKPAMKKGFVPPKVTPKNKDLVPVEEKVQPEAPQPQFVAVPRAVPVETMLNEIYDSISEQKQILAAIYQEISKLK